MATEDLTAAEGCGRQLGIDYRKYQPDKRLMQ